MRRIIRSRLPERLGDKVPPRLVELAVGLVLGAAGVGIRLGLSPFLTNVAPYTFVFAAVTTAAVLAGWRSGLIAMLVGQALSWFTIVAPWGVLEPGYRQPAAGLLLATISQAILLAVIGFYQREVDKGAAEREQRVELLEQARREMDHRAKNNFQTVLSLIQLQAARENDANIKHALQQIADRILAISVATEHLAIRGDDLATVRLRDHLCELCSQLERGLARGDVRVECDIPDVTASADTAIHLAIIVNELVTNSLKHAFREGRNGLVQVRSTTVGSGLELEVTDDGDGMTANSPSSGTGLGQKLVETFAKHLDAKVEVSSTPAGTTSKILVPALT
nr:sensor histidine kinase [Sphingomonas sp.]